MALAFSMVVEFSSFLTASICSAMTARTSCAVSIRKLRGRSVQLVEEKREPIARKPGQPEKYDYEYRRTGVANIFLLYDRHPGWRHAKATTKKTAVDFAECMRELVDVHYPTAEVVRVVLDNLSTHSISSLYTAFAPEEALRIAKRLEFHYTPKHASWLNMVEIEIGIMNRQCLDRRIHDMETLRRELSEWQESRNQQRCTINWMFNVENARHRLGRAYPQPVTTSGMVN
ncbi:MAG: IS630 family transposase [Myxococcota bacterium]